MRALTQAEARFVVRWMDYVQAGGAHIWPPSWLSIGVGRLRVIERNILTEQDRTFLAEMVDGDRLRLALPNQLTHGIHAGIRSIARARDLVTYCLPDGVRSQAGIQPHTIQVVHSIPSRWPRAEQQLIKATVTEYETRGWRPSERETYFLSGYDANERGLSYFFCELPSSDIHPATVGDAYAMLKPPSVRAAERMGIKVLRQGDIFLVRMPRSFTPEGPVRSNPRKAHGSELTMLYETNHVGDQHYQKDSLAYVRGALRHRPRGRRPDHKPVRLGRRWWLAVRNTVPVSKW